MFVNVAVRAYVLSQHPLEHRSKMFMKRSLSGGSFTSII